MLSNFNYLHYRAQMSADWKKKIEKKKTKENKRKKSRRYIQKTEIIKFSFKTVERRQRNVPMKDSVLATLVR